MQRNFILVAIVVLLAGCKEKIENVVKEQTAIRVKTQSVQTFNGLLNLRYSGTVEASQTIPLSFRSLGTVEQVLVQEGDAVRKGQLLASVDKADNQSVYNSSLAMYQQAKDAYDRLKQVYDNGSLPEVKWVEMETNMKKAQSQWEVAKSSLDKCNLYAPTNGVIGKRNIEPGQSAMSGFAPLELVKIEKVLVKISVPENEIGKLKKGISAGITISALNNRHFDGTISHVGVVADQFSRTYEVKITVENSELDIKPGMVCDVVLNTNDAKQVVLVPYNAVTKDDDGNTYVFVVTSNQKSVKKQIVTVGDYQSNGLEIIKGLTVDQVVVVEGKEKLMDNSLISL
ncbi:MAG: efflux RND transporter periplasmic adaptor subunit [Breznakibacter sp.]